MTTLVNFLPTQAGPFQFQATLDGQQYVCLVTWSLYGRRYYIDIYDTTNTLVSCVPQIGSPPTRDIDLLAACAAFKVSKMVWRPANGQFEITP